MVALADLLAYYWFWHLLAPLAAFMVLAAVAGYGSLSGFVIFFLLSTEKQRLSKPMLSLGRSLFPATLPTGCSYLGVLVESPFSYSAHSAHQANAPPLAFP